MKPYPKEIWIGVVPSGWADGVSKGVIDLGRVVGMPVEVAVVEEITSVMDDCTMMVVGNQD